MRSNPNGRMNAPSPEILPGNTVTVSIGRNVGPADALNDDDWLTFRAEVAFILGQTIGKADTHHSGSGVWNGRTEESVIYSVFTPKPYLKALTDQLAALAEYFRQDTIAVTIGQPLFVAAARGQDSVPGPRVEVIRHEADSFTGPRL